MLNTTVRLSLARALETVSPHNSRLVVDAATLVEIHPTPFLTHYRIYRIRRLDYPMLSYIGFAPQQPLFLLPGQPQHYIELAQADGVRLQTPQEAIAYMLVYFEVTRSLSELFYVISSVDEVRFRPIERLSEQEQRHTEELMQRYRAVITAAQATQHTPGAYLVTLYAMRNQVLECHYTTVQQDGAISDEIQMLEQDLPVAYAR